MNRGTVCFGILCGKLSLADSENQRAARLLLYHGLGGNLDRLKTTAKILRETVAGIRNTTPASVRLPIWVGRISIVRLIET